MWPRGSSRATGTTQLSSTGCTGRAWTAHDGCERKKEHEYLLYPNLGAVDDGLLHAEVLPGGRGADIGLILSKPHLTHPWDVVYSSAQPGQAVWVEELVSSEA